ncbi:hypothetical protein R0I01_01565 [Bacillus pumilus]|nr:hypothetical protein R0I01_01565 [Bacillus pumilus]
MANVYLAEDMILDREVAIKILRFDFASDDDFIRRFRREAQSAASLDHSNYCQHLRCREEDIIYNYLMIMSGDDAEKNTYTPMARFIRKEAVRIMEQVVRRWKKPHAKTARPP